MIVLNQINEKQKRSAEALAKADGLEFGLELEFHWILFELVENKF